MLPLLIDRWQDGDRFWKLEEIYIRGSSIKYIRLPEEVTVHLRDCHPSIAMMQAV